MLQEGLRQDALLHAIAGQLSTKTGLFMVFAAFVFTAESSIASVGSVFGVRLTRVGWVGALLLSLCSILALLRCAFLEKYSTPPILSRLREQTDKFLELSDIKRLPEDQQLERFKEKFLNSLERSIVDNFESNARISRNLDFASWFVFFSVMWLFGALIWAISFF